MKLNRYITLFLTGIILVGNTSFYSPLQDAKEYSLKAAFVYRFTDYIDWPADNNENFTIDILGESGITSPLNDIARDKKIKNKNVSIKVIQDINDIGSCQILFISHNYPADITSVISKIGDKPVLIIAEQKDACREGAQINFLISEDKLKFEINLKAVAQAGIKISSDLLQHAIIINN